MTEPSQRICRVGDIEIGPGRPLVIIGGPCTLESLELGLEVGRAMKSMCDALGLPYIFKASFDKANRSSAGSQRGPGIDAGLAAMATIKADLGVPATTDIHTPEQAERVATVVDLLQIPAFLCRQTDLVVAAGEAASKHGLGVNIKKGQFLSPAEMMGPVRKSHEAGCDNLMLTERGTFFGYHRLVNDFTGLGDLMELDCSTLGGSGTNSPPVCFDVTHSTQLPGSGEQTGGRPDRAPLLTRAAVAAGVHALFIECHPNPSEAWSDGATQIEPAKAEGMLRDAAGIRAALR